MIKKYCEGALLQTMEGAGIAANNHLLVRYSNDFSIYEIDGIDQYREQTKVFFSCHEFEYGEVTEGYEPYLSIISMMFHEYGEGSFADFMEACDVYELHRPILESYFETGVCERDEAILLNEVGYEQSRMTKAIVAMLNEMSKIKPIVIALNRFQMACGSTMKLTYELLCEDNKNISILLGVNEVQAIPQFLVPLWEKILERMEDHSQVYHIGSSGRKRKDVEKSDQASQFYNAAEMEEFYRKIHNLAEFLDFEQASYWLNRTERSVKFDNMEISEDDHYLLLRELTQVSILSGELSKAVETLEDMERLLDANTTRMFEYYYLQATAYMYLGKLQEAMDYAKQAHVYGELLDDKFSVFKVELLNVQIQMSGWCNIFFCTNDVYISESLISLLQEYNYRNHLAHIYIYAFDNKPEIAALAYESEENLVYFSKGIAIAKEIGNEQLISAAYRKNIMLASTNGIYEVSLLYWIRTYESTRNIETLEGGRIFSGIGYTLCAMGQNERAQIYYDKAIEILYKIKEPGDIAEVQYNMALNCIMLGDYRQAEIYLTQCMHAIEKLQLNSLRVCNLSKLYGLLALASILQNNRFNCERYLYKCKLFLNYILEKEKMENELVVVHDYAKCDDDLFLYNFSQALLKEHSGEFEAALRNYEAAEEYLERAEGNQFFCYALFRKCKMSCYHTLGKERLFKAENLLLDEYEEENNEKNKRYSSELLKQLPEVENYISVISAPQIEEVLKYESIERSNKSKKRQLDFIATWQKQIDITGVSAEEMLEIAMKTFLNHFNVDRAVYIRYMERAPQVLYNNTEVELNEETLSIIEHSMKKNTGGYVVSKISSNYSEHQDITTVFGDENICSIVAIPFFNNAKIESIMIAYVTMKDNWHSSVNRYLLDEDDLNYFQLLFREVRYSLNRLEAYEKIYEMNTKLYLSAVTDQLTGIYNRDGFYRKLAATLEEMQSGKREAKLGLMFVDLDNFKHYNDTFGHDVGDLILVKMAELFSRLCEEKGFVCRYGGDEFLLLFYQDDKIALEETAKQIYREIEEADGFEEEISQKLGEKVSIANAKRISCSIGITIATDIQSEKDMNKMIKQADELLYSIKTSTKGTYKI